MGRAQEQNSQDVSLPDGYAIQDSGQTTTNLHSLFLAFTGVHRQDAQAVGSAKNGSYKLEGDDLSRILNYTPPLAGSNVVGDDVQKLMDTIYKSPDGQKQILDLKASARDIKAKSGERDGKIRELETIFQAPS